MSNLVKRSVSAFILLALLGALTWSLGSWGMLLFGGAICLLAIYEYSEMHFANHINSVLLRVIFCLFAAGTGVSLSYLGAFYFYVLPIAVAGFIATAILVFGRSSSDNAQFYLYLARGSFGIVYLGAFPAFALQLLIPPAIHWPWFLFLLVVVFSGDTFAYLIGRTLQGPKLMPTLSPNKTLSGSMGGIVGSILGALLIAHFYIPTLPLWYTIITGVIIGTVAQLGDLFESLMKRVAQVKDSGSFMPGHGGALDRLDGVILAAPISYLAFLIWQLYIY